jgi:hypothetical protein
MTNTAVLDTQPEYMEIQTFCKIDNHASSTVHTRIRKGEIALHQFMGDSRPKINVAEARQVLANVKRRYSLPTLRIVRHDDSAPPKVELSTVDLFS